MKKLKKKTKIAILIVIVVIVLLALFLIGTNKEIGLLNKLLNTNQIKAEVTQTSSNAAENTYTFEIQGTDKNYESNSLIESDIVFKIGGAVVTPTTKTLSSPTSITNGVKYTLTVTGLNGEGDLSIEIPSGKLVDKAQNQNSKYTKNFGYIDAVAPSTPVITNTSGEKVVNEPIKVTASSTDAGTKVNRIEYSYDNQTWKSDWNTSLKMEGNTATVENTWTADCNYILYVRAIDNQGNISGTAKTLVRIDNTIITDEDTVGPTISISGTAVAYNKINVTSAVKDTQSGFTKLEIYYKKSTESTYRSLKDVYVVSQDEQTIVTPLIDLKDGVDYNIYAIAYDNVGNKTTSNSITVHTPYAPAGTILERPSGWINSVQGMADGYGTTIPLPQEFYYVQGDRETGIVISDSSSDDHKSGGRTGNQFVWIPTNASEFIIRVWGVGTDPNITESTLQEPYSGGYSTEAAEYNEMKTQVLKYGGFYIGRYEAGDNSVSSYRTATTAEHDMVVKYNKIPYNHIPWGQAINNKAPVSGQGGAVHLSETFATNKGYTSVKSTLTYSIQWDAACYYIGTNPALTQASAITRTGVTSGDVKKNIHDLAGNVCEWTMEYVNYKIGSSSDTNLRMSRGGCYKCEGRYYITGRQCPYWPYKFDVCQGFRPSLYITPEVSTTKIDISSNKSGWTNQDVIVTAQYTCLTNQKIGYGTTIAAAKSAASTTSPASITVTKNGYVYAEGTTSAGKKITAILQITNIDKTAPTNTGVEIKNKTNTSYDVYVYGVADSDSGITRVQFPTWTTENGQDDIQTEWSTNSIATGKMEANRTTWVYHVDIADHNNELGEYNTHVYIYDKAGNSTVVTAKTNITITSSTSTTNIFTGKKVIIIGDSDGIPNPTIETCLNTANADIVYSVTNSSSGTAGGGMDLQTQRKIMELANQYGAENLIVILGTATGDYAAQDAETLISGDPTFAGPLTGVALNLEVYHIVENIIKNSIDSTTYEEEMTMYESVLDVNDIVSKMQSIRGG